MDGFGSTLTRSVLGWSVLLVVLAAGPTPRPGALPTAPYGTPTVVIDVSWEHAEQLLVGAIATDSLDPVGDPYGGVVDAFWVAGCAEDAIIREDPAPLVVQASGSSSGTNWAIGSGTYDIVAYSSGYCVYPDSAGNADDARLAATRAAHPEGSTFLVTATVSTYGPDDAVPVERVSMSAELAVQESGPELTYVPLGSITVPEGPEADRADADDGEGDGSDGAATAGGGASGTGADDGTDLARLLLVAALIGIPTAAIVALLLRGELAEHLRGLDTSLIRRRPRTPGPRPTTGAMGGEGERAGVDAPITAWSGDTAVAVPPGEYPVGQGQSGWVSVKAPGPTGAPEWMWAPSAQVHPIRTDPVIEQTPGERRAAAPGLRSGTYRAVTFADGVLLHVRTSPTQWTARTLPPGTHVLIGSGEAGAGEGGLLPVFSSDGTLLGSVTSEDAAAARPGGVAIR